MAFLHNTVCPECRKKGSDRSGNNLGVWDDHVRCWACPYYQSTGLSLEAIANRIKGENKNNDNSILPADCSFIIPPTGLAWLKKYGLTDNEILDHEIRWSNSINSLVFPVREGNGINFWSARYFGDNPNTPKYIHYGPKQNVIGITHSENNPKDVVILVEDRVSSIKVGRQFDCKPLFGASISLMLLNKLSNKHYTKLIIWLDLDKAAKALMFCKRAEYFFERATTIVSEADPKTYSNGEIHAFVTKSLS